MMHTRAVLLAGLLTAAAALAGCTTTAGGDPTPDNDATKHPSSTPPSSEQDRHGAPRVDRPLAPTRFLTEPCATLTQAQLAGLGIDTAGKPDTDSAIAEYAGPTCGWQDNGETLGVGFVTGNKNGLADLYGNRENYAYFEETMVNGFPAVFQDNIDLRDSGTCSISVGVTDNLHFKASEQGELDAQGACDRIKNVAGAVITTMKGA